MILREFPKSGELDINAANKAYEAKFGTQIHTQEESTTFVMPIEDAFQITGKGLLVVGRIVAGSCSVGDAVDIILSDGNRIQTSVTCIEKHRQVLSCAHQGDNVGIGLSGIRKDQIKRGDTILAQALSSAGAAVLHTTLMAHLHLHETHNAPIFNNYHPVLLFSSAESWIESKGLIAFLDEATEYLAPGENAEVGIVLDKPCVVIEGMTFGVHEGGSSFVANGKVSTIIE